jgi:O-antigen/teichoic acid export membrane protein
MSLKTLRRIGREFLWVVVGQGASILGGALGVRVLTHALSPSAYGELALAMTVALLAQQAIFSPVSGASLRFYASARDAGELPAYLWGVGNLLEKAVIVLLVSACVLGAGLWVVGRFHWVQIAGAAFVYALLSGCGTVLDNFQNAARQRTVVAWHDGLSAWLRFIAAVGLIGILGASGQAAILGYLVASGIVLTSQYWFFRRRILPLGAESNGRSAECARGWAKQMSSYAWPFAAWGLFTWAQAASDRWALQTFGASGTVGLYSVLYQLGYYPISLLSGLLFQLVSPVLFSWAGDASEATRLDRSRHVNSRMTQAMVLITLLATGLAFCFYEKLFWLLVGPQYRSVSSFLPWMVLSGGLFASGQVASLMLMTDINTKRLIAPKIGTASLGVVMNVAGAYLLGLVGVIFAHLVFSCVYCGWILYLTHEIRREAEVALPRRDAETLLGGEIDR